MKGGAGETRMIREAEQAEDGITIPKRWRQGFVQTDFELDARPCSASGACCSWRQRGRRGGFHV